MNQRLQRLLLGLVGTALLGPWVLAPRAASATGLDNAAPTTSYVVQPEATQSQALIKHGYFTLTLQPGQKQTVYLVVKNTGMAVLRLSNYAADATQIAAGGIDFGTQSKRLAAVGNWIVVTPRDLVLKPGEARRVSATITLPKHLRAGDFVGGIALENKQVQGQGAGSHVLINIHYRKGIAILESVPGIRVASAKIVGVALNPEPKGSQAVVSVTNTGNVLFRGNGTVALMGSKGAMQRVPFKIDTILVGATAQIPLNLSNVTLKMGTYGMQVQLNSVHNVSLARWHGNVGFMLPVIVKPGQTAPNVVLQPAQSAAHTPAQTAATTAAPASSQSVSPLIYGGGGVLVLLIVIGLGVFIGRRSAVKSA